MFNCPEFSVFSASSVSRGISPAVPPVLEAGASGDCVPTRERGNNGVMVTIEQKKERQKPLFQYRYSVLP